MVTHPITTGMGGGTRSMDGGYPVQVWREVPGPVSGGPIQLPGVPSPGLDGGYLRSGGVPSPGLDDRDQESLDVLGCQCRSG